MVQMRKDKVIVGDIQRVRQDTACRLIDNGRKGGDFCLETGKQHVSPFKFEPQKGVVNS